MACRCNTFQPSTFKSLSVDQESHLQSLLRSNADSEEMTTSTLLTVAENDLERCEKELAIFEAKRERIEVIVDSLQNQRHALNRFIQDANSLKSPIRKLSVEILRCIFVAVEAESYMSDLGHRLEGLYIATVCTRWREVALSTRELWCNVVIDASSARDGAQWAAQRLEAVKKLLELSGQHPLSLALRFHRKLFKPLVDILRAHSHRWHYLDLWLPKMIDIDLIPTQILPSLQHLRIQPAVWHRTPPTFSLAVTTLTLEGLSPESTSMPEMKALLHPELKESSLVWAWHLLGACPSLVSLSVHRCHPGSETDDGLLMPVNLRSLTTLVVRQCELQVVQKLFSILALPKLDTITIDKIFNDNSISYSGVFPVSQLTSMIRRELAIVKSLSLILPREAFSHSALETILDLFPSLENLTFRELPEVSKNPSSVLDNLFKRMNPTLQISPYKPSFPRLVYLKLHLQDLSSSFSPNVFINMLKSRWNPTVVSSRTCSNLKMVSFRAPDQVFVGEDLQRLRVLKRSGMAILLKAGDRFVELGDGA